MTSWPSLGLASSTVFVRVRSAWGTSTVAESELLVAFESRVDEVTAAVLVIATGFVTCATMSSVAWAPLARLPIVQVLPA